VQPTPGGFLVKPITIGLLYYNDGAKILRHLTEWEKFEDRRKRGHMEDKFGLAWRARDRHRARVGAYDPYST
jgi:hypothetical protein